MTIPAGVARTVALALAVCSGLLAGQSAKRATSPSKPVQVHQYTRKGGTIVHAHRRALPGRGQGKPRGRRAAVPR
jgi:hypothetical protein